MSNVVASSHRDDNQCTVPVVQCIVQYTGAQE